MARAKPVQLIPGELVASKIYVIRGTKVMLDQDLAVLYGVETKRLNEQVKRNSDRFPADFMFQLNQEEFSNLRSQFATSSWGGVRKAPYAFTEQGVAMLSGVIHSETAIAMNIAIMRAFVQIRKVILENSKVADQLNKLEVKLGEHDAHLNQIYSAIENLLNSKAEIQSTPGKKRIGFRPDE